MKFWFEWTLAIHRAVWFPYLWLVGLERPGVALPVEVAPGLVRAPAVGASMIEGRLRTARKRRPA